MAADFTEEERKAYAALLYADPVRFCREVLPQWFPLKMPWVHRGILALILQRTDFLTNFGGEIWRDEKSTWTVEELRKIEKYFVYDPERNILDPNSRNGIPLFKITWDGDRVVSIALVVSNKLLVIMPRGFSKTTLMNAAILFLILYQMRHFIVYLSETDTHSKAQLNNIKCELNANTLIKVIYGDIVPDRSAPETWREGEIETLTGVHAVSRGRGGQVRGLNRRGKRPDLILFDDVEDKESVATPEQRQKAIEWLKGDVEPALKEIGGDARLFGLGTLLHREAMLPRLMKDPEWISVVFGAVDPGGDLLWPAMMGAKALETKRRSFASTGTLHIFYREYLSIFKSEESSKFKPEYISHIMRAPSDFLARALAMDPAISEGITASDCTFAVVGITERGRLHVLECKGRKGMSPREQIDTYFDLHMQYDCTHHGIESIAYQTALVHLMREEMFRKAKTFGTKAYFEIEEIKHGRVRKDERILGVLQPRYAAKYITHQQIFYDLEAALLDWPNGQMDYPDVVAMAVTLLDPFAATASDEDIFEANEWPSLQRQIGGKYETAP